MIENLIETGLEAKEAEKRRFFELAERLRTTTDKAELQQERASAHDLWGLNGEDPVDGPLACPA